MVIYISTHAKNDVIVDAIIESGHTIVHAIIEEKFSLENYIKENLGKFQATKIFMIDIDALKDDDDNVVNLLNSFRIVNEHIKIIIIASYKKKGDKFLSDIFGLAIYNIIANIKAEDKKTLKDEIMECICNEKAYKDSVIYKDVEKSEIFNVNKKGKIKPQTIVKEKIVVKKEIISTVNKALIGIIGTQNRVGVTHNCIVCANYLKREGFKVAVLENSNNTEKSFNTIENFYAEDLENREEKFFTYRGVDYYPDFNIVDNYKIQAKNYNFIIMDFGIYSENFEFQEFSRCIMQIVCSGTKPWELDKINQLFSDANIRNHLKTFNYLFSYTKNSMEKKIKQDMGELNKVYIAEYAPDPFEDEYSCLQNIFKEYLSERVENEKKINIVQYIERMLKCAFFKKS